MKVAIRKSNFLIFTHCTTQPREHANDIVGLGNKFENQFLSIHLTENFRENKCQENNLGEFYLFLGGPHIFLA